MISWFTSQLFAGRLSFLTVHWWLGLTGCSRTSSWVTHRWSLQLIASSIRHHMHSYLDFWPETSCLMSCSSPNWGCGAYRLRAVWCCLLRYQWFDANQFVRWARSRRGWSSVCQVCPPWSRTLEILESLEFENGVCILCCVASRRMWAAHPASICAFGLVLSPAFHDLSLWNLFVMYDHPRVLSELPRKISSRSWNDDFHSADLSDHWNFTLYMPAWMGLHIYCYHRQFIWNDAGCLLCLITLKNYWDPLCFEMNVCRP